jgi:hypothetical protein
MVMQRFDENVFEFGRRHPRKARMAPSIAYQSGALRRYPDGVRTQGPSASAQSVSRSEVAGDADI